MVIENGSMATTLKSFQLIRLLQRESHLVALARREGHHGLTTKVPLLHLKALDKMTTLVENDQARQHSHHHVKANSTFKTIAFPIFVCVSNKQNEVPVLALAMLSSTQMAHVRIMVAMFKIMDNIKVDMVKCDNSLKSKLSGRRALTKWDFNHWHKVAVWNSMQSL